MTMEDVRLKAMEMAQRANPHLQGKDLISAAEEIYQWLRYGQDGATDVRKALAGVSLTDGRTGETRPACVVAKDDDILDRLRKNDGYEHE